MEKSAFCVRVRGSVQTHPGGRAVLFLGFFCEQRTAFCADITYQARERCGRGPAVAVFHSRCVDLRYSFCRVGRFPLGVGAAA